MIFKINTKKTHIYIIDVSHILSSYIYIWFKTQCAIWIVQWPWHARVVMILKMMIVLNGFKNSSTTTGHRLGWVKLGHMYTVFFLEDLQTSEWKHMFSTTIVILCPIVKVCWYFQQNHPVLCPYLNPANTYTSICIHPWIDFFWCVYSVHTRQVRLPYIFLTSTFAKLLALNVHHSPTKEHMICSGKTIYTINIFGTPTIPL